MAGYTPVFDSVYAGSLCGRWPTTAVWVTLLPLCDKHGHIDLSHQAICALTGWPLELLQQGIAELMKPDPDSRSSAEDGRRLALLDPEHRNWGWRVVNHGLYREKARKLQYDNERTASGKDAERKRVSREVPRSPDTSREVPLSDSDSDSDSDKEKKRKRPPSLRSGPPSQKTNTVPDSFTLSPEIQAWSVAENPELDVASEFAKFHDHEFREPHSDWLRAWRRWVREGKRRGEFARRPKAGVMMFAGKPVEWQ